MKAHRNQRSGMVVVVVLVAGLMLAGAATAFVVQASPLPRPSPTQAAQVQGTISLIVTERPAVA